MKKFAVSVDGKPPEGETRLPETTQPKRKAHRGAPQLTVEVGRRIVAAIAAGNFPEVAARLAGVSQATLEKWLERGDRGEQPYADFAQAFYRAEDEGEAELVALWKSKAPDDWRAAKELLAKRHGSRERWSDAATRQAIEREQEAAFRMAFQITIHLGDDDEYQKRWDEQVRQRELAMQKKVIETVSTPVKESAPATPTVERYRIAPPKNPRDDDSDNNNGTPGNWN